MPPETGRDVWPHTGAVLAGGGSRRMGRPKHALRLPDGRTMIEAVAAALGAVCRQVVVVGTVDIDLPRVDDRRAGRGPLGGVEALLCSGLDTQYLVCPCDVPLITPELLRRLAHAGDASAVVLRVAGEPDFWPLPARIPAGAAGDATGALDDDRRALHEFMRSIEPQVVEIGSADAAVLANVNTPQQYADLCTGTSKLIQSPPPS